MTCVLLRVPFAPLDPSFVISKLARKRSNFGIELLKIFQARNVKSWFFTAWAMALGVSGGTSAVHAADDMSFRLVTMAEANCATNCLSVISAEGQIVSSTPNVFLKFISQHSGQSNLRAVVYLHSPGGSVQASMRLGHVFRKLGVATVVARANADSGQTHFTAAGCFSACVYALMGGKKRVIPPQSLVGVHRMFSFEPGVDPAGVEQGRRRRFDDGHVAADLNRYTQAMGVSRELISVAEHSQPDALRMLSREEIRKWRLGESKL